MRFPRLPSTLSPRYVTEPSSNVGPVTPAAQGSGLSPSQTREALAPRCSGLSTKVLQGTAAQVRRQEMQAPAFSFLLFFFFVVVVHRLLTDASCVAHDPSCYLEGHLSSVSALVWRAVSSSVRHMGHEVQVARACPASRVSIQR